MAVVYATEADYLTYTGETSAPSGIDGLLTRASAMLDARVFRLCVYDVDVDGAPTSQLVEAAFRDATCAQVQWWDELGDSTGASAAGWGTLELGTARLSRSVTRVSAGDAPARQVAPQVWDVLRSPHLTADVLRIGVVSTL